MVLLFDVPGAFDTQLRTHIAIFLLLFAVVVFFFLRLAGQSF